MRLLERFFAMLRDSAAIEGGNAAGTFHDMGLKGKYEVPASLTGFEDYPVASHVRLTTRAEVLRAESLHDKIEMITNPQDFPQYEGRFMRGPAGGKTTDPLRAMVDYSLRRKDPCQLCFDGWPRHKYEGRWYHELPEPAPTFLCTNP